MAEKKAIPPLRKKTAEERGFDPNSLTAALFWDKMTDEALGEAQVLKSDSEAEEGQDEPAS